MISGVTPGFSASFRAMKTYDLGSRTYHYACSNPDARRPGGEDLYYCAHSSPASRDLNKITPGDSSLGLLDDNKGINCKGLTVLQRALTMVLCSWLYRTKQTHHVTASRLSPKSQSRR